MNRTLVLLLLLSVGSSLSAQSACPTGKDKEQTGFGSEDDFCRPISISPDLIQALLKWDDPHHMFQQCAKIEGTSLSEVPQSWFSASEIRLSQKPSSGLVIRGERCFRGAHATQFWVVTRSDGGYRVVLQAMADGLSVLRHRTNGYRDLQIVILTRAARDVQTITFKYDGTRYEVSGRHVEHNP